MFVSWHYFYFGFGNNVASDCLTPPNSLIWFGPDARAPSWCRAAAVRGLGDRFLFYRLIYCVIIIHYNYNLSCLYFVHCLGLLHVVREFSVIQNWLKPIWVSQVSGQTYFIWQYFVWKLISKWVFRLYLTILSIINKNV